MTYAMINHDHFIGPPGYLVWRRAARNDRKPALYAICTEYTQLVEWGVLEQLGTVAYAQ